MQIDAITTNGNPVPSPELKLRNPAELGKEDFLRLLVTQLEHQDPLNPVSNEEFIAQTAQFSALEQMQNLNKTVGDLIRLERIAGNAALANYLGRSVEVPGNSVMLQDGQAILGVTLASPAQLKVEVRDAQGTLVRTLEPSGILSPDEYRFVWDGTDDSGQPLPEGLYRFTPIATAPDGSTLTAQTFTVGPVSGLLYEGDRVQLRVNEELIDPESIRAVVDDEGGP